MLTWLIRKRLTAFEKQFSYDASYIRDMLDADPRVVFALARARKLFQYRRDIPLEPYFAACLIGSMAEDCGPCTQLGVTIALQAGTEPRALAAVLAGDEAKMTDDVRLAVRYAKATLAHRPEADALRDEIVTRWGQRALISLAFGLAGARFYPTIKYALGHGKACQRVVVAGTPIAVAPVAA